MQWRCLEVLSFNFYVSPSRVPVGLEDVSKIPALFAELIRRGYSDSDIKKIARLNLIRVFKAVEEVHVCLCSLTVELVAIPRSWLCTCMPVFTYSRIGSYT